MIFWAWSEINALRCSVSVFWCFPLCKYRWGKNSSWKRLLWACCYREWFSIAGKIYACMSWLDVELSLNRRSQIRSSTFPFHVSQSRHGEKNESGFYWDASPVHQHINRYLFSGDHQTGAWKGKASKIRLLDHMNLGKPRKARIISSPESACLNREEDAGFAGSL